MPNILCEPTLEDVIVGVKILFPICQTTFYLFTSTFSHFI